MEVVSLRLRLSQLGSSRSLHVTREAMINKIKKISKYQILWYLTGLILLSRKIEKQTERETERETEKKKETA